MLLTYNIFEKYKIHLFHCIRLRVFTFVPPYNTFFLFPFITFIFPKFLFYHFPFPYIIYSTFSIVLIVFPVLLFQCSLLRLPHVISSNSFPVVFPVRRLSHFLNSWPVSYSFFLPDATFPVFRTLLDCFSAFLFQFFSFHPTFPRQYLQNVVFSEFSFNSKVFFPFHLSPRLFAIRFQAACFSWCLLKFLGFRLGTLTPSYS